MLNNIIKYSSALTLALVISGCGGGGSGSDSQQVKRASQVSISDFVVDATALSRSEFLEELNENDDFFFTEPEELISSAQDECIDNKMSSTIEGFVFQKDSDDSFYLDIPQVNVSECFPEVNNPNVLVSLYINKLIIHNANGESIDLSGLHYNDVDFDSPTLKQARLIMSMALTGDVNGIKVSSKMYRAMIGSSGFDSVCIQQNPFQCTLRFAQSAQYTDNSHLDWSKSITMHSNANYQNQNDTYFSSGTIDFAINNWTGTMTYTGANTAPTFTAYSDTDSTSGTFNYSE